MDTLKYPTAAYAGYEVDRTDDSTRCRAYRPTTPLPLFVFVLLSDRFYLCILLRKAGLCLLDYKNWCQCN